MSLVEAALATRRHEWAKRDAEDKLTVVRKRGGGKPKVSAEEFVRAWQSSNSLAEVMAKTGLSKSGACLRGTRFRRYGVKLKVFQHPNQRPDVEGLNRIISEGE